MWDGRPARPERAGGTPTPQTCVNYLIRDRISDLRVDRPFHSTTRAIVSSAVLDLVYRSIEQGQAALDASN
ncbi:MAG: hypothetical protein ICV80_23235 [Microcoleus sp. T1-bin1]|nr:hypothetical protein [Microcoleus sp. T1-bin1]MBD0342520.1 hypothetical protein [Microcoleus sp. Co-bin12]